MIRQLDGDAHGSNCIELKSHGLESAVGKFLVVEANLNCPDEIVTVAMRIEVGDAYRSGA
jgi:hypothetical protein